MTTEQLDTPFAAGDPLRDTFIAGGLTTPRQLLGLLQLALLQTRKAAIDLQPPAIKAEQDTAIQGFETRRQAAVAESQSLTTQILALVTAQNA